MQDIQPERYCTCEAWRQSANQIFTAQIAHTQRTGIAYTGQLFVYCPFCGNALEEKSKLLTLTQRNDNE